MPLTKHQQQIAAEAADRFESDPDLYANAEWREAGPLRAIAHARDHVTVAKDDLAAAVVAAHHAGFSWTAIAAVLGVTRQAARQRFGGVDIHRGRRG